MSRVTYVVVEHDGGWAYKVGDVFSETFASHDLAKTAAVTASNEQNVGGNDEVISYEDASGEWHEETAKGGDRPETIVEG